MALCGKFQTLLYVSGSIVRAYNYTGDSGVTTVHFVIPFISNIHNNIDFGNYQCPMSVLLALSVQGVVYSTIRFIIDNNPSSNVFLSYIIKKKTDI